MAAPRLLAIIGLTLPDCQAKNRGQGAGRDQNSGTDYLFRRPVVEANGKPSREKGCLSPTSPQIDDGDAHPSCFSSGRCSIPEHYNYPARQPPFGTLLP